MGDTMLKFLGSFCVALTLAAPAYAGDKWVLSGDDSKIAYGSIKKDVFGEVNHFTGVSGEVSAEGKVEIEIDLMSVETWIDIRNERMREHVFGAIPKATLTAEIDMDAIEALEIGQTKVLEVDGTLGFGPEEVGIFTTMFVARLGEDRALVATDEMIMISTEELNIDPGIDKLMELAELPGITRAAPVTLRLVFDRAADGA